MAGIVGIFSKKPKETIYNSFRKMANAILHRKYCESKNYINLELGTWIEWFEEEGELITNETKDIFLIFIGESFYDNKDIEHLRAKGHQFTEDSYEYLVHLYEDLSLSFLKRINGIFCGILIDLRKKFAMIFNDRYGLRRIYYYENKDEIYFSTEAKAILAVYPNFRQIDYKALAENIICGCTLKNKSIFAGISILPVASSWKYYRYKGIVKESYFAKSEWENQEKLGLDEYYEKLKNTWIQIIPRYFRRSYSESLGISLTGGVDGRLIMAWSNCAVNPLPCYTFGGMFRDSADVIIARKIAKLCNQKHVIIKVNEDFITQFPNLAEKTILISDGSMDVSGSVDLYSNGIAKNIASIRLTGNYGQEILRSSIAFKPRSIDEHLFDQSFKKLFNEAKQTYLAEMTTPAISFIVFKQIPWYHHARFVIEASQIKIRSPYLDNQLVSLAFQSPLELTKSKNISFDLISDGDPRLSKISTDRGIVKRPNNIFLKLGKISSSITFKAEYFYDYGMPKWLSKIDRKFSKLHPEKLFLGRHKFYHFRIWYRDALSKYVKEILLDNRTLNRNFINSQRLKKIVKEHIEGSNNHTIEIHSIITIELIHRLLIDK